MPGFFENWLASLTPEQILEMLRWIDFGRCTDDEIKDFLTRENTIPAATSE
jgi:hypothetical protein